MSLDTIFYFELRYLKVENKYLKKNWFKVHTNMHVPRREVFSHIGNRNNINFLLPIKVNTASSDLVESQQGFTWKSFNAIYCLILIIQEAVKQTPRPSVCKGDSM